jgi:hypothetical protein
MRSVIKSAVAAFCLAGPALAETDLPMVAKDFEAFVQGRNFEVHDQTRRYGVVTFLPGRRAVWQNADLCMQGSWRPDGVQICYDEPELPFQGCWIYLDQGTWMMAWREGDRANPPIMLYPTDEVASCEGYFGV